MVAVAAVVTFLAAGWYIYRKPNRANFPVSRKARFILPALSIIAFWDSTQHALLSRQTKMELSRSFYNSDASQYSISTRTRLTRIFRCGCMARSGTQASECSLINGGMVTGTRNWLCTLVFMPPFVTRARRRKISDTQYFLRQVDAKCTGCRTFCSA